MKPFIFFNLFLLFFIFFTPQIFALETPCPPTLPASFETPSGWQLKRETMELTFIGSSLLGQEFSCYYGVGRVALSKKVKSSCKLKNSHKNPLGIDQGKICNGQSSDCSLICP